MGVCLTLWQTDAVYILLQVLVFAPTPPGPGLRYRLLAARTASELSVGAPMTTWEPFLTGKPKEMMTNDATAINALCWSRLGHSSLCGAVGVGRPDPTGVSQNQDTSGSLLIERRSPR